MKKKYYFLFAFSFYLINHLTGQTNYWYAFPGSIPEAAIRYIYVDDSNTKWVGGFNNGLHKFKNNSWIHYNTSNSGISDGDVRQSCFDTSGNLWMATWKKLSKFNTKLNTWVTYNVTGQSSDILSSVAVDSKNRVWVGTDGGADSWDGLYMFNGTTWKFYNPTNSSLTGRWLPQLRKDRTGKIWGCHYQGLFEINDTVITNHLLTAAGFSSNCMTTAVDFDTLNNKWVAVYGGGIGKFNGSSWTIYTPSNSPLPEDKIWAIAVDAKNIVWIGTETKGLVKFDGTNWTVYNSQNSIITSTARVDVLNIDKMGNLWIGNSYGAHSIIVHNPSKISGLGGYVFNDMNNNNIKDSNEPTLPGKVVQITSTGDSVLSDGSGYYFYPVLDYSSISFRLKKTAVCQKQNTYSVTFSPSTFSFNQNIGYQLSPNMSVLKTQINVSTKPQSGFKYNYDINISSIGNICTDSFIIKLLYDNSLGFDSVVPNPFTKNSNTLTWLTDSVSIRQIYKIKPYFSVPPSVPSGTILRSVVTIYNKRNSNDSIVFNEFDTVKNFTSVPVVCLNHRNILVFPNPNNGKFTIKNSEEGNTKCEVEVYNILGEEIFSTNLKPQTTNSYDIDISNNPKGIYFLKVSDREKMEIQKIVLE